MLPRQSSPATRGEAQPDRVVIGTGVVVDVGGGVGCCCCCVWWWWWWSLCRDVVVAVDVAVIVSVAGARHATEKATSTGHPGGRHESERHRFDRQTSWTCSRLKGSVVSRVDKNNNKYTNFKAIPEHERRWWWVHVLAGRRMER